MADGIWWDNFGALKVPQWTWDPVPTVLTFFKFHPILSAFSSLSYFPIVLHVLDRIYSKLATCLNSLTQGLLLGKHKWRQCPKITQGICGKPGGSDLKLNVLCILWIYPATMLLASQRLSSLLHLHLRPMEAAKPPPPRLTQGSGLPWPPGPPQVSPLFQYLPVYSFPLLANPYL